MPWMKRWLLAFVALAIGGGVSAALLVAANPARTSIEVYIAGLRKKIDAGSSVKLIHTVRGHGYVVREEEPQ